MNAPWPGPDESRFRPRYTTGLNSIEHPSDPKFRTGVDTDPNLNPFDRNRSPSPGKVAQADDVIGHPNWQRHGNEYRDIRTHEALPATLIKRKLIWHQLKSGRRRASRDWKTRTIYYMQPPSELFVSSPHPSRLSHLPTQQENSTSQSLRQTINIIQYISPSLEQLIKYPTDHVLPWKQRFHHQEQYLR